jgi:DNA polymerase III delta subunit
MGKLILAIGSADNFMEDVHVLARQEMENPKILPLSGLAAKAAILEMASALFIEEDAVIAVLDPPMEMVRETEKAIAILKERITVIIYSTSADFQLAPSLNAVRVVIEQVKEKRLEEKVRLAVRAEGKKMTEEAFSLLKERIRDEALLETELSKLMGYVGDRTTIKTKDVAAIVSDINEEDFITLANALARRDKKELMSIVDTLLSQGTTMMALHGFMARQIRLLLQAKECAGTVSPDADFRTFSKGFPGLKQELRFTPSEKRHYLAYQKPFYAYKLCKTSEEFSRKTLVSFLRMLAEFDLKVKTGTKHDRLRLEAGLLGV